MNAKDQSSFLSQVDGFTPVIDTLAQELGLVTAVVYGIVWRYCQMENKVCTASLETIAEHANINRKTVERHIKKLCDHGYLEDRTPDAKHMSHTYADTGKAKIIGLVSARVGKTESPTKKGKTESPTDKTESPTDKTESPTRSDRKSYRGKTESTIKRVSEETLQERGEENSPAPPPFSDDPTAGLPRATDGHQRAVDRASGGGQPDPVEEVALHHYRGFMGGPEPLPDKKRERAKWLDAGRRLLNFIPQPWDLRAVCAAVDRWWADGRLDEFWKDKPRNDNTLELMAKYVKLCGNARDGPASPGWIHEEWQTEEPDFIEVR